ncbi:zinc-binding dehydrogenase [Fictibacillus sp. WQ 8-8]|uniref:zinc-binding dehydrogenase n=1 Tax=Fictibacillus sp. WQ 8-8 TaxID=2938788 RepID=UPI00210B3F6D|nr:zinc-binding dehydrogenase [Fictibacillus sp. WQ 8-8]MCQ6268352.1 zinc-binding dehydrogenase [Fictibacillus sp. WQ 8-8]
MAEKQLAREQITGKQSVPDEMRAVMIRHHGGPETLTLEKIETPVPGPGEVLIKVEATALNHLDIFAREGLKGPGVPEITLPHISGVDIAGTVSYYGPLFPGQQEITKEGTRVLINPAIGCNECRWCRRGEPSMCPDYKILGEHFWGGLAEYVVAPARNIIPVPDHVSSTVAAAIPAVYTTAWRGVVTVAKIKPSDIVLVVGASGGLGSAQLEIAAAAGATVIGTASTEEKREKARKKGAAIMFDSNGDWESEIMDWTKGQGVSAVFDAVGAPTIRHSLRCLEMGGKLVLSGATAGDSPELSIREIYQRHRIILGAPLGNWEDFLQVTSLVWQKKLQPSIHKVYPLEDIAEAQLELEGRKHFGKIVIKIS